MKSAKQSVISYYNYYLLLLGTSSHDPQNMEKPLHILLFIKLHYLPKNHFKMAI